MKAKIAVLAGDGVGREVVPEAVKVLKVVAERHGHTFDFVSADVGGQAIDKIGVPLPQETLTLAKQSDAVLLGAVGGPKWEGLDYSLRPERALLGLREALGLYANLRPAKLYTALADASTLKKEVIEGIDILVVRELIGGIYFGKPKGIEKIGGVERGVNTEVYTTDEIKRIAKVAFEAARKRRLISPGSVRSSPARNAESRATTVRPSTVVSRSRTMSGTPNAMTRSASSWLRFSNGSTATVRSAGSSTSVIAGAAGESRRWTAQIPSTAISMIARSNRAARGLQSTMRRGRSAVGDMGVASWLADGNTAAAASAALDCVGTDGGSAETGVAC